MEHFRDFLQRIKKLSSNSIKTYLSDIRQFSKWFEGASGSAFPGQLDQQSINLFREYLTTDLKLEAKSVNRKLFALKTFNEYLIYLGQLHDLVITKEIFLRIQKNTNLINPPRVSRDTFDCLKAAVEKSYISKDQAIFYLLVYAGLRVSELCKLTLGDVNKNNLTVYSETGNIREIPLNNITAAALHKWLSERKFYKHARDTEKLFISSRGPLDRSTVNRTIEKYCRIAGIEKLTLRQLRNYFLTNALEKGLTISEISLLTGNYKTKISTGAAVNVLEVKSKLELL